MNASKHTHGFPVLPAELTGPCLQIEQCLLKHQETIEDWFHNAWQHTPAPFYASVDLRNAGFKLSPVDTNLFPAGFNNIDHELHPLCIQAAKETIDRQEPTVKKILLIPESHTRNLPYFDHLASLYNILNKTGAEVRIGSLLPGIKEPTAITTPSNQEITLYPITRANDLLTIDGFTPELIILNHDMSDGIPELLEGLEQPIMPPLSLGWSRRLKSIHFTHYQGIAEEFSSLVGLDPWLINPLFRNCGRINFKTRAGEDCLVKHTTLLLKQIQAKYQQYDIKHKPFVIIKADAGSYGMGVMTIRDPEEIHTLNRKQRAHMAKSKGGQTITQVLIQEGVYTFETLGQENAVAEPVVYTIGQQVVGGFYRVHTKKDPDENLNAPGMHFEPIAFADSCMKPNDCDSADGSKNRFYTYGVVARLALLAAARELL